MTTEKTPGQIVHASWRDGMLAQGRSVSHSRMHWHTLTQEDRDLDDSIAAAARAVPSRLGRDIAEDIMIALGHDNTNHHKRDPLVLMVWKRLEACGLTTAEDDR